MLLVMDASSGGYPVFDETRLSESTGEPGEKTG